MGGGIAETILSVTVTVDLIVASILDSPAGCRSFLRTKRISQSCVARSRSAIDSSSTSERRPFWMHRRLTTTSFPR
eukprot:5486768-Alexandrium_andersonii.AAC.1